MIPVPLHDVARLVAGRLHGAGDPERLVTRAAEVDSRLVEPGGLFVALRGEQGDGHDFAPRAVEAGAVAVLAERALPGLPTIVVPDALTALQALARALFVSGGQPLTFGITGSTGKTTTKDLMAQVLSARWRTLAPRNSYNNEIGLPLTVLRREPGTQAAVLEYSARGVGHIAYLCGIAAPDISVVLNVGSAHVGEFGSREAIALAKGELVEAARRRVVLNAADPLVAGMAPRRAEGVALSTFGEGGEVRAEDVRIGSDGRAAFRLVAPGGTGTVALRVRGEHQVDNALAAAAAVLGAGEFTDVAEVAALLASAEPVSHWRMEVSERADGVTVVNDAYNASPESVRGALRTLAVMTREPQRRAVAVLGPMAELGPDGPAAHEEMGRLAGQLGIAQVLTVGPEAAGIGAAAAAAGSAAATVADRHEALAWLRTELLPGDVVLVKAARSVGLERLALALLEDTA